MYKRRNYGAFKLVLPAMKELSVALLALALLGSCATRQDQNLRDAIKSEEQLKSVRPPAERAREQAAVIQNYSRIISSEDSTPGARREALYRRAQLYARQSDCKQAIEDVSEAIREGYRSPRAYMVRAYCERSLGALENAKADIGAAISLAPEEPALYVERAQISQSQNELQEAITDLSKAISLTKSRPSNDWLLMRGDDYFAMRSYEQAIEDYRAAVKASMRNRTEIMNEPETSRTAQLAPIYQKLSAAYSALAHVSEATGRP